MQRLSPIPPSYKPAPYIPEDRPVYRIGPTGFYGPDCRWYVENDIIVWKDEPSLSMYPLNDMAEAAYVKLLEKLDEEGKKSAQASGKRYRTYMDRYMHEKNRENEASSSFLLEDEIGPKVSLLGEQLNTDKVQIVAESTEPVKPKRRGRPSTRHSADDAGLI